MVTFQFDPHDLMIAGAVSAGVLVVLIFIKAFVLRQLGRLGSNAHLQFLSYPKEIVDATRLLFMIGVALLLGLNRLDFTARQEKWLQYAWIAVLLVQVALWGNRVIVVAVSRTFEQQRATNPGAATHVSLVGMVARIFLWTVATLILLDNFGVNISALVASLGIGGIAVALAAQNILGDLFSSVSIALDKPFTLGDFIIVGDFMGTVENVGMKTTRLRSLGGEQIIISNTELLKNKIRNYKRMQERRIQFEFGIAYETATAVVEQLPQVIREIIVTNPSAARFDRAHFKGFGDSALLFEVVYYVLSPDYNQYMDIQQAINLALLRQLSERGVEFAYPTRTLRIVAPINGTVGDPPASEAVPEAAGRRPTY